MVAAGPTRTVPDALLAAAADLVRARTGLVFSPTSEARFAAAVRNALKLESDPDAYLARLKSDPRRVDALGAATTIAESYFFRDSAQFTWLRREALPNLCASGDRLRVWSAGCAGGEEPYSIAILLREMGHRGPVTIIGSDLAPDVLVRARRAVYSRWALRSVAPEIIRRWFRQNLGEFTLDADVKNAVQFVEHNLAADPFPPAACGFEVADLIVCRNVLIYFDRATVARVAERMLEALQPNGWLLLGASDPPIAELTRCDVVVTHAGLAYRRSGSHGGRDSRVMDLRAAMTPPGATEVVAEWAWERYAPATDEVAVPMADAAMVPAGEPALAQLLTERYRARDYRGAVAVAERMLRVQAAADVAWIVLVRSLANLGDLEQAGRANALAVERCPLSAELTYLTGLLLSLAGRHAEAAGALRRALYLDHTLAVAHVALGSALSRSGDRSVALRAFANAEQLLSAVAPGLEVPAGDGETAGAMLTRLRTQRRLVSEGEHAG
ncbi:MAG TPA: CheR family methyltransferase [Gemmatimonadaceae bacterium]|nr:CheR family methyltransferase [Gemmatimonadaceae bacterium]